MNRENMLLLREAVAACPVAQFDYRFTDSDCGCVLPISEIVFGEWSDGDGIVCACEVDDKEADYLMGFSAQFDPAAKDYRVMTPDEAKGAAGISEALRRIDVILARYPEATP